MCLSHAKTQICSIFRASFTDFFFRFMAQHCTNNDNDNDDGKVFLCAESNFTTRIIVQWPRVRGLFTLRFAKTCLWLLNNTSSAPAETINQRRKWWPRTRVNLKLEVSIIGSSSQSDTAHYGRFEVTIIYFFRVGELSRWSMVEAGSCWNLFTARFAIGSYELK